MVYLSLDQLDKDPQLVLVSKLCHRKPLSSENRPYVCTWMHLNGFTTLIDTTIYDLNHCQGKSNFEV